MKFRLTQNKWLTKGSKAELFWLALVNPYMYIFREEFYVELDSLELKLACVKFNNDKNKSPKQHVVTYNVILN